MDIFQVLHERRSIRKFTEEPVAWDQIVKIIDAAMSAPSSGNLQNWKFVIITDTEKRKAIAEASLQQYWMEKAPVHIVVCSAMSRIKQYYGVRGERLYAIQNCAAAVQNMLLTAHALGLGACWVGAFDENEVQRVIGNPDDVRIETIIPIGHPDEQPPEPLRYKIENTCFFESYGNRMKDKEGVLWNFNVGGRTVEAAKKASQSISRKGKHFIEHVKKKLSKKSQKKK